jgi:ADP-heptose:LPS heptosyltransferase
MRASLPNRSWGIDYLQRLAYLAREGGWRVALLDNREAMKGMAPWRSFFSDAVDLCGNLSITDLRDVVAACDVCVSPDTGIVHLAEAVGTKCVTYFTTVPPELRVKHYRHVSVLYPRGKLPCLGCAHNPTCGQPDPKPCATLSTPEMVWQEVLSVHEEPQPWTQSSTVVQAPAAVAPAPIPLMVG